MKQIGQLKKLEQICTQLWKGVYNTWNVYKKRDILCQQHILYQYFWYTDYSWRVNLDPNLGMFGFGQILCDRELLKTGQLSW